MAHHEPRLSVSPTCAAAAFARRPLPMLFNVACSSCDRRRLRRLSSTHDVAFFFTSTVFCELCCGCLPRLLSERRYREDHACTSTPYTAPPPSPPTSASPASSAALWTLCSPFVSHGHEAWIQHCVAIGVSHTSGSSYCLSFRSCKTYTTLVV